MDINRKSLLEQEARASMCAEATIPGDYLRELIRLAIIGLDSEQQQKEEKHKEQA